MKSYPVMDQPFLVLTDDPILGADHLSGAEKHISEGSVVPPITMELYLDPGTADIRRMVCPDQGLLIAVQDGGSPFKVIGRLVACRTSAETLEEEKALLLDRAGFRVRRDGRWLRLNPMEFELLAYFCVNPERVIPRTEFIATLWTTDRHIRERSVDVRIKRLRKALGDRGDKGLIRTHRSAGYYLSQSAGL